MGVGNDLRYTHSRCFNTFPFPTCTSAQQAKIRALGEQLDAHRKRQQALHPELTMTGMYNVLERVRALEDVVRARDLPPVDGLSAKEKQIYDQGLVGILKQLHDELDAAVAEAYGWALTPGPSPGERGVLSSDEILTRLVALNAERAAEEAKGTVRWLRPEYQAPVGSGSKQQAAVQGKLVEDEEASLPPATATANSPREWPDELPAQAATLTEVLASLSAPASVEDIAAHFEGKRTKKRLEEMTRLLETLAAVGRARKGRSGWSAN
jgi:hypothetical protein